MTHRVYKQVGRHRYAYDYASYYDAKLHRTRQRMVRYLGRCDENGTILVPAKATVDHVHSSFEVGPLALFYAASQELELRDRFEAMLGVDRTTASLLLTLSLNQIAGRQPISRLSEWTVRSPLMTWEGLGPAAVTHEAFQTALMTLCRPAPGGFDNPGLELQHRLTEDWRHGSREPAAAYYDITKQPYYGTECPYAALGHDGEGNLSNVVGFGLVISRDHHHPVLCRPLLGSKNDTLSVRDTVNQLKDFGFERLTLVMDRGMVSEENLKVVTEAGYEQVGIVRGWNEAAWKYVTQWPREALEQPRFVVSRSNGEVAYCRGWKASLYGRKSMRVAVVLNPWRADQEQGSRDLAIKELTEGKVPTERLRQIRRILGKEVAETARGRRGFTVNEKTLAEKEKGLGRFLLFSTDTAMDPDTMFELYFQRDAIEKVFETMKGELSLGPIRYRRTDRLESYATIVYVAYLLWSWVERKLTEAWPQAAREVRKKHPTLTLSKAVDLLEGVSWVRFGSKKSVRDWTTRLTDVQEEILRPLDATKFLPAT